MGFATTVKAGRRKLNMTQKEFAELLDVPVPTLQGWEKTDGKDPNQATQNYIKVAVAHPEMVRQVLRSSRE